MSQCRDLDPEERLLVGIVKMAIRDAQQDQDERWREEAARWLWDYAPGIAARAQLPQADTLHSTRRETIRVKLIHGAR